MFAECGIRGRTGPETLLGRGGAAAPAISAHLRLAVAGNRASVVRSRA